MHHRFDPDPTETHAVPARGWWRRLSTRLRGRRRSRSVTTTGRVDHVVDPDGTVQLFRVSGLAVPGTIAEIARRTMSLDGRHTVHLDLHDATFASVHVVEALEQLADRLERSRVRIRMVGLDPHHPALDARR